MPTKKAKTKGSKKKDTGKKKEEKELTEDELGGVTGGYEPILIKIGSKIRPQTPISGGSQ